MRFLSLLSCVLALSGCGYQLALERSDKIYLEYIYAPSNTRVIRAFDLLERVEGSVVRFEATVGDPLFSAPAGTFSVSSLVQSPRGVRVALSLGRGIGGTGEARIRLHDTMPKQLALELTERGVVRDALLICDLETAYRDLVTQTFADIGIALRATDQLVFSARFDDTGEAGIQAVGWLDEDRYAVSMDAPFVVYPRRGTLTLGGIYFQARPPMYLTYDVASGLPICSAERPDIQPPRAPKYASAVRTQPDGRPFLVVDNDLVYGLLSTSDRTARLYWIPGRADQVWGPFAR